MNSIKIASLFLLTAMAASSASAGQAEKLAPLGPPPIPADNPQTPAKVELGKLLFFDPRLGGDGTVSCASCHLPSAGWGFPDDLSMGYPGTVHWRNSQTIMNTAYYGKLFWAGKSKSLEAQAARAAKGAVGGNGEADVMEARLAFIPEYRKRFKAIFGGDYADGSNIDRFENQLAGLASLLHRSGLNGSFATGTRSSETAGRDDATFYYGKIGYIANLTAFGKTAFSADYMQADDIAATGDEAMTYGIFAVQKLRDHGTEFYGGFRNHELDRPGVNFDDIQTVLVGTRVKF